MRNPLVKANSMVFEQVNKVVPWHELPRPLALLNLRAFRDDLREMNLYGPTRAPEPNGGNGAAAVEEVPKYRTYDGSMNDPAHPEMGMAGVRFGRNHPLGMHDPRADAAADDAEPARGVSTQLLNRDDVQAGDDAQRARRRLDPVREPRLVRPRREPRRPTSSTCRSPKGDDVGRATRCRSGATSRRPTRRPAGLPPTYVNTVTHWWDGSQIYGSSEERSRQLRTGEDGKMIVEDGRLPERGRPDARRRRPDRLLPTTTGSGCRCCTRCSSRSTTRSATTSRATTRPGTTSGCS